jgi:thioredoxin-dependent peroxiredoxin
MLQTGDEAPGFTLSDQHGNPVSLGDFLGRRVMIFWYPKASTPG